MPLVVFFFSITLATGGSAAGATGRITGGGATGRIAGGVRASASRIWTCPRLSGRRLQTEAVKAYWYPQTRRSEWLADVIVHVVGIVLAVAGCITLIVTAAQSGSVKLTAAALIHQWMSPHWPVVSPQSMTRSPLPGPSGTMPRVSQRITPLKMAGIHVSRRSTSVTARAYTCSLP